jgi:hypothetical protein
MTGGLPLQSLTCPDPDGCAVAVTEWESAAGDGTLPQVTAPSGRDWFRVYDARDGVAQPNPGYGDTRFAPFDDLATGARVPTLYLAETLTAALLETTFHDVAVEQPRVVTERALLGKLHGRIAPQRRLNLADLRDDALRTLRIGREQVSSSSSEHYPCTRRVARAIHASPQRVDGIIWHSRQAELNGRPAAEVVVLFADRVPTDRRAWSLAASRTASGALLEGAGRLLLDQLAEDLGVTILGEDL